MPIASTYRVAWRNMAATTGYRTLYPALVPPGACHVHTVTSCAYPKSPKLISFVGGVLSSLVIDFFVRSTGMGHLNPNLIETIPLVPFDFEYSQQIGLTFLELNCLTKAYSEIYISALGKEWTSVTPIKNQLERQKAQAKIDALTALGLGLSFEDLVTIYQSQFPVMRKYDMQRKYNSHGRLAANREDGLIFDRVAVWKDIFSEYQ